MKKSLLVLAGALALAGPALAFTKGIPAVQGDPNGTPLPVAQTPSDTPASGTLSAACADASINSCAANTTVSVAMAGQFGASYVIPASSTLVATLKADCGFTDAAGTTTIWQSTFLDAPGGDKATSTTLASGTAASGSIIGCRGAARLRIRLSAFTSGTATGSVRGSFVADPSLLFTGAPASTTQPPVVAQVGGWDGTKLQPLALDTTTRAAKVVVTPKDYLGCYTVSTETGLYTGLTAGAPMFSMRWTDATKVAVVLRFTISVAATVAASSAGIADRELVLARSFTVSDSGGTAVTLTGNNAKHRTSMATSVMGDMRIMGTSALTAGTRTLDAQGFGLGMTTQLTGAITAGVNGQLLPPQDLFNASNGGAVESPIVLAQNEGLIMRMKTAQPTSATHATGVTVVWCEASAATAFP